MTTDPRGSGELAFHLVVYSDAGALGGAEVNLSRVISSLPRSIRLTIVGVNEEVVDWLASHRSGTSTMVLPAIRDRTDVREILRHRSMFMRLDPDVLQFNLSSASSCQWSMLAASTIRGLPRVAIENSPMGVWSSTSAKLKRLTSKRLSSHIAVGDRTARMIETSSGLEPGSISTIYHGVPLSEPVPTERPAVPTERPAATTLLTVARHDPVKGVDVLLDAFATVIHGADEHDRRADAHLVLIGSGTETGALKNQCASLNLDSHVEFRDVPFDVPVAGLMSSFDALILPSRLEGFPVTIVEAMLAGLPVVATDVGSVDEAVDPGVTGWIVPPENPEALAAAIIELLSDLETAKAMGRHGKKIAEEQFTMGATIDAYMAMYRRILAD